MRKLDDLSNLMEDLGIPGSYPSAPDEQVENVFFFLRWQNVHGGQEVEKIQKN